MYAIITNIDDAPVSFLSKCHSNCKSYTVLPYPQMTGKAKDISVFLFFLVNKSISPLICSIW